MIGGGLTPLQAETLATILARYAGRVRRVLLFGSRATGRARPGSDVDLALIGADQGVAAALLTDFIDSDLSLSVDVVDFDRLADAGLRAAIDRDGIELSLPRD